MDSEKAADGGQLSLASFGPDVRDGFRFTWFIAAEGAPVWIEHRGAWRAGVIVHRARKYVTVMLPGLKGRTRYVRREYGELRRRVVRPRLVMLRRVAESDSELRRRR